MLLQTNSYVVPKDKRAEHARLLSRFRQTLARFGCEHFEVFEQAGSNWGAGEPSGRYVQLIRFRDKKHHQQVQAAERSDPAAQKLISEFCELINFPYQQQQGLFAVGFYNSVLPVGGGRRVSPLTTPAAAVAPVVASLVASPPEDVPVVESATPAEVVDDVAEVASDDVGFTDEPTATTTLRRATADERAGETVEEPEALDDLDIDLGLEDEQTTDVDLSADEVDLIEPERDDERGKRP